MRTRPVRISRRVWVLPGPFGDGKTSLRGAMASIFNTNNQQNLVVRYQSPGTPHSYRLHATRHAGLLSQPRRSRVHSRIQSAPCSLISITLRECLQRQPATRTAWDTIATIAYAGSRGVHLLRSNDVNKALPTAVLTARLSTRRTPHDRTLLFLRLNSRAATAIHGTTR